MAHTVFTNGVTLTDSSWFNDNDSVTYTNFGDGTNYTGLLTTSKINNLAISTGSFTVTLTGVTTTVTGTAYYSMQNNSVILDIPILSGTSNTTACTITGIPSALQPVSNKAWVVITEDSSSGAVGLASLAGGSGTITLFKGTTPSPTFTGSGAKGLSSGMSVSYTLN